MRCRLKRKRFMRNWIRSVAVSIGLSLFHAPHACSNESVDLLRWSAQEKEALSMLLEAASQDKEVRSKWCDI